MTRVPKVAMPLHFLSHNTVSSFYLREIPLQNLILRKGSCLDNVHLRSNYSKIKLVIFIEILKRSNEKGLVFPNQFGLLLESLCWFSDFLFFSPPVTE